MDPRLAVGYCRVSGLTQANDDRDGLPRQKRTVEQYAKANNLRIVRWYSDDGISGTTELEDRPALFQLRQDLVENGVRCVVIEKLDRLARDLMVSESILADFQRHNIEIISTQEPDLCSTEPSRKFIRQVLSAMAEYDRAMIVQRLREGKRRTGRWGGKRRYGMNPAEVGAVNRINFLRRNGYNASRISEILNAEAVPTRGGGKWFPNTVLRILRRNRS